jgi:hypothetical protein
MSPVSLWTKCRRQPCPFQTMDDGLHLWILKNSLQTFWKRGLREGHDPFYTRKLRGHDTTYDLPFRFLLALALGSVWSRRFEKFPIRLIANGGDQTPSDDKLRLKSGIKEDNFKAVMEPARKSTRIKCNCNVDWLLEPQYSTLCGILY